jgi:hypothetical protein
VGEQNREKLCFTISEVFVQKNGNGDSKWSTGMYCDQVVSSPPATKEIKSFKSQFLPRFAKLA